jgi:OmcA/MtrC family decaheme c-type cytochrome
MRIPSWALTVTRAVAVLAVVAGSLALMGAAKKTTFTPYDKAYYADPNTVNFVRPGFVISIVSADIAKDGTMSVHYKLSDPKGLPLDLAGVQTPGTISVRFLMAYIPKGQKQFASYITSVSNGATRAGGESNTGPTQTLAVGDYVYTFLAKAPTNFDASATHRVGVYGSRNLTEFDLGTNYDDATFDWVPNGSKVTVTRDVVRTESCNKCHDQLAFHGGTRRSMELCIMCHQPQTVDSNGNSADMKVMAHAIHMGKDAPNAIAGKPYKLGSSDWSKVSMPSDARRCEVCHDPATKAAQADAWFSSPSRAACGACHDNVNFASGQNHVNLPQVSDNQCSNCHVEKGTLELDASIRGAHIVPTDPPSAPGIKVDIVKVDDGVAGKTPTVTFTVRDNSGNGLSMADLTGGANRIGLVMAGPTSDYGQTSFGSDVTTKGYVSENPVPKAKCSPDGTCTYTFAHAVPASAKGTFAIGIEARRAYTILPGTTVELATEYGAINKVVYFSVDGSKVQPRRKVVDIAKCNSCHSFLSLHGENRNQIEQCVLCHNSNENDAARRVVATNADDKAAPPQSIDFALMIHKIHTGEKMASEFGTTYTVVGFGGSHNDFSEVRYPVFTPSGSTGDTAKCYMCHVNNSETVFPISKNDVLDPQGMLTTAPATTAACTACHQTKSAVSHSQSQTDAKFGESCDVCHGSGSDFDVQKVHAGK